MKTIKSVLALLVAGIVISGCHENAASPSGPTGPMNEEAVISELMDPEPDLHLLARRGVDVTMAQVVSADDGSPVGMSFLARYHQGILSVVKTSELEPGTATTLWWVFFNKPAACDSNGCDDSDLLNLEVRPDIVYADGQVIDASGRAVYVARKRVNDTSGSVNTPLLGMPEFGLQDLFQAEVHVVIRSHGPVIPGMEHEMTTTFNGGCSGEDPVLGHPGPNTCTDVQFGAHIPR